VAALAAVTIVVGNVGALGQSSLKRMLAYSSVAQAGYMLAGVVVATGLGVRATVFYLAIYLFMNMAAFATIVARERETGRGDSLQSVAGLARERPWLAWPLTLSMLSLAGIPATAGFVGKFYLIDAAISGGYTWLGVVIVVGSMLSLGYYLPVVAAMWMREAPTPATPSLPILAGGSPELDDGDTASASPQPEKPIASPEPNENGEAEDPAATCTARPQPEIAAVAILAGAATLFFGLIPQPLFDLVHGAGSALGLF
jgi:NADH-quinone oxidoreductase subunit N